MNITTIIFILVAQTLMAIGLFIAVLAARDQRRVEASALFAKMQLISEDRQLANLFQMDVYHAIDEAKNRDEAKVKIQNFQESLSRFVDRGRRVQADDATLAILERLYLQMGNLLNYHRLKEYKQEKTIVTPRQAESQTSEEQGGIAYS